MAKEITDEIRDEFLGDFSKLHHSLLVEKYGLCMRTLRLKARKFGFKGRRPSVHKTAVLTASMAAPVAASEIQRARQIMGDNIENYPRLKELMVKFNEISSDTTLVEEVRLTRQSEVCQQFLSEYALTLETRGSAAETMAVLMRMVMQRQDTISKSKKETEISEEQVKAIGKKAVAEGMESIKRHLHVHERKMFDGLLQTAAGRNMEERKKAQDAQREQLGPAPIEEAEFVETK